MLLRFDAHSFCHLCNLIGQIWIQLYRNIPYKAEAWNDFASAVVEVRQECEKLNLHTTLTQIKRIEEGVGEQIEVPLMERHIKELQNRIFDELEGQLLFIVPISERNYYEERQFSDEVARNFFSALHDMEEAGKCFALGRNTACVFHLMRVMEAGLQHFGQKLGVNLAIEKNWQNILDEVNKAIKNIPVKTREEKILQLVCAESAAHLFNVKLAWRNPVMHPKAIYSREEAGEVFHHVKAFMDHLATKIMTSEFHLKDTL